MRWEAAGKQLAGIVRRAGGGRERGGRPGPAGGAMVGESRTAAPREEGTTGATVASRERVHAAGTESAPAPRRRTQRRAEGAGATGERTDGGRQKKEGKDGEVEGEVGCRLGAKEMESGSTIPKLQFLYFIASLLCNLRRCRQSRRQLA